MQALAGGRGSWGAEFEDKKWRCEGRSVGLGILFCTSFVVKCKFGRFGESLVLECWESRENCWFSEQGME